MNDQDPMIARAMEVYSRGLDVLESGDSSQLAALASELESFPHGDDPYLGRRWITNAIDVGSLAAVRWLLSLALCSTVHRRPRRRPTKLLDLIESCATPTDMLRQLRDSDLLSPAASDEDVLRVIDEGQRDFEGLGPGYPYSSAGVHIKNKLSSYLSEKGHQWGDVDPGFWPKPEQDRLPPPDRDMSGQRDGGFLQRAWRRLLGK